MAAALSTTGPAAMLESVCCPTTGGGLLMGVPPMVGSTSLPLPLRMTMMRSAISGLVTGESLPHLARAFSTAERALLFALGSLMSTPRWDRRRPRRCAPEARRWAEPLSSCPLALR